jgi:hypothetical protein
VRPTSRRVKNIEQAWKRLKSKHDIEMAETVVRYCFGHEHEIDKVAAILGQSVAWIKQRLRFAASDANDCVYQSHAKQILRSIKGGAS